MDVQLGFNTHSEGPHQNSIWPTHGQLIINRELEFTVVDELIYLAISFHHSSDNSMSDWPAASQNISQIQDPNEEDHQKPGHILDSHLFPVDNCGQILYS